MDILKTQRLTEEDAKKEEARQSAKQTKRKSGGSGKPAAKLFSLGFFGEETDAEDEDDAPAAKKPRKVTHAQGASSSGARNKVPRTGIAARAETTPPGTTPAAGPMPMPAFRVTSFAARLFAVKSPGWAGRFRRTGQTTFTRPSDSAANGFAAYASSLRKPMVQWDWHWLLWAVALLSQVLPASQMVAWGAPRRIRPAWPRTYGRSSRSQHLTGNIGALTTTPNASWWPDGPARLRKK